MDYGRLFLFMIVATATMAIGTHLWCWIYSVVFRLSIYWRIDRLRKQLEMDNLQEVEIERRRAVSPRYLTWEQAMVDFRGDASLDDILDRLNGKFPPNAADIQNPGPSVPTTPKELENAISGPVLATTIIILAIMTGILGVGPTQKGVEELIRWAREKHDPKQQDIGSGT